MTKGELVKALEEYPDNAEIEMEFENINCEEGTAACDLKRVYDYETETGTKIVLAEY